MRPSSMRIVMTVSISPLSRMISAGYPLRWLYDDV
jgi:hypothetical protein